MKNAGARTGAEIAQVYVQEIKPVVPRPLKELKGFARVTLGPGASKVLSVNLDPAAFSYYDVATHAWKVNPGEFRLLVGSSSTDIRLAELITIH